MLAREARIPYPTSVSAGIAHAYRLAACPKPGERPDLDDLVWAISLALNGAAPAQPWPSESGPAMLVEFSSFVKGSADATLVQVVITKCKPSHGRVRFLVSQPGEAFPAILPIVLVAEDDAEIARAICWKLGRHGFDTILAATGVETLERAAECQPDIVLLDVDFPDVHGFTVCTRLRTGTRTREIPVMICSAWIGAEAMAVNAGAGGCIEKLDFAGLVDRMRQILAAWESM